MKLLDLSEHREGECLSSTWITLATLASAPDWPGGFVAALRIPWWALRWRRDFASYRDWRGRCDLVLALVIDHQCADLPVYRGVCYLDRHPTSQLRSREPSRG